MSQMSLSRHKPPVLAAFAVLMFLPVLLGIIDIGVGLELSFAARLTLWNLPWMGIAGGVVILAWLDARQAQVRFWVLKPLDFGIIAFIAVYTVGLSRMVAANPAASDLHLLRLLLAIMVGISAYYSMFVYQNAFCKALYSALIAGALLLLPLVIYLVYFQQDYRKIGASFGWFLPGFGGVRLFGIYYETAIALCLGLFVITPDKAAKALLWLMLVILWAALFWSGGRGAVLSLVVSVGLVMLLDRQRALTLWGLVLTTGALGAALSLVLWVPEDSSFGIVRMQQTVLEGNANAFSAGRLQRWKDVIDLIMANPVFGYGLGQFSNIWSRYGAFDAQYGGFGTESLYFLAYRNVHNIWLEAFFAWGAFAVLFFAMLLKTWIRMLKRVVIARATDRLPAFIALNALLFHANFTGIYVFPHSLIYIAVFFGICLAPYPARNGSTKR